MKLSILLFAFAIAIPGATAQAIFTATRLRVEYLPDALTIDVAAPKFSYALAHPNRGEVQTSYQIQVIDHTGATIWDSGKTASAKTLNLVYAGANLISDSDYTWKITSWDSTDTASTPATAPFSTALLNTPGDFAGAAWTSSSNSTAGDGDLNTYRTTFTTVGGLAVTRARLYIAGMGYWKGWVNGQPTDDHELGTFTTFERRVLYDVVDITAQLQPGCNALGFMLGHGWFAQPSVKSGPRQFLALVSVTTTDGTVTYYTSSVTGSEQEGARLPGDRVGAATPLSFVAIAGPVFKDDIYVGENYDGRIAYALSGWSTCAFKPNPSMPWSPATAPSTSPAVFGSILSSHAVQIRTDKDYSVVAGGPNMPGPNQYVYNFGQNMAGQITLSVNDCPEGTVIVMRHSEILYANGSVHNHYAPGAPMMGVYICNGQTATETYRYLFSYMGFQYVQLEGYPGIPDEESLTAHFIHSDLPQTGQFTSSNTLMNAIQHATRYASFSNLMDIPTDCPQRERRGWLGDAQLSFETVIHNWDGGAFYTKWIKDFVDTQVYDNATMNAQGALPDCIPFYGHGHTESDPGWGIAAWNIPDWFANYYDDDSFEAAYYPYLRWYMEHWVTLATANKGIFPIAWWGDWAEYYPGPYGHRTEDYAMFFYVSGLQKTLDFATRLNINGDVTRYTQLLADSKALYLQTYYNATTHCYVDCLYVSQIFGLSLGLQASGSADEAAVWANAMSWFDANGTNAKYPNHFGGGIIALKLAYPLLDKFGQSGLGLTWQLQNDIPSFGYWIDSYGATTLGESYELTATNGVASYNHIMFGGSGNWYYSTLAGLGRVTGSRSWQNLAISPPGPASGIFTNLSWASASIDTPMGLAESSWTIAFDGNFGSCGTANENDNVELSCNGGTFTNVLFASFGTPTGTCVKGFAVDPACNWNGTVAKVSAECLGKSSCSIPATTDYFGGDPCFDVVKSLSIKLQGTCQDLAPLYALTATVPVNAVATVNLPAMLTAGTVDVFEGSAASMTKLWSAGTYIPGVAGISGAAASADGSTIVISVGSGAYAFSVMAH